MSGDVASSAAGELHVDAPETTLVLQQNGSYVCWVKTANCHAPVETLKEVLAANQGQAETRAGGQAAGDGVKKLNLTRLRPAKGLLQLLDALREGRSGAAQLLAVDRCRDCRSLSSV